MSINSIQNLNQDLELNNNLIVNNNVVVEGDMNIGGDVYNAGIPVNILSSDNTWTGENTFTNDQLPQFIDPVGGTGVSTGNYVSTKLADPGTYNNFLAYIGANTYTALQTFQNDVKPTCATAALSGTQLVNRSVVDAAVATASTTGITNLNNTFTGTNDFTAGFSTEDAPTTGNALANKTYVDNEIAAFNTPGAGNVKTLFYDTPGAFTIPAASLTGATKLRFHMVGGGADAVSGGGVASAGNIQSGGSGAYLVVELPSPPTGDVSYDITANIGGGNTYILWKSYNQPQADKIEFNAGDAIAVAVDAVSLGGSATIDFGTTQPVPADPFTTFGGQAINGVNGYVVPVANNPNTLQYNYSPFNLSLYGRGGKATDATNYATQTGGCIFIEIFV